MANRLDWKKWSSVTLDALKQVGGRLPVPAGGLVEQARDFGHDREFTTPLPSNHMESAA